MIITLLTIASWPFLVVFGFAILWTLILAYDNNPQDYVAAPLTLILGTLFALALIFTDLYKYMAEISWKCYALGILSYIIVGIAYSFFKFYSKCKSRFNDYLTDKANFRPGFGYGKNIDNIEQWMEAIKENNTYVVDPFNNKGVITAWMAFWVLFGFDDLFKLIFRDFWSKLYDQFVSLFNKISLHFKNKIQ